jgi:poly(3-hydroxyalkanoate) synthetase
MEWLKARSGELKAAPKGLGNKTYPAGDAAPGICLWVRGVFFCALTR